MLSFHFLYITEASTLAGEKVLGSLRREMMLKRMVLGEHRVGRQGCLLAAQPAWPQLLEGSWGPW